MEAVQQALGTLVARPEVAGAALASGDGLLVAARLPPHCDAEALAALGATLLDHGRGIGRAAHREAPDRVILDAEEGPVVVCRLADAGVLIVLAEREADIGHLLYDLRQQRDALARLL